MALKKITEDARETEIKGEYDALVVGGGPAGISASIAASRSGARTLLLERYGFLGGMATLAIVGSFCGFFTTGPYKKAIIGGIAGNLIDRLREREGVSEKKTASVDQRIAVYQYNPELLKCIAEAAVVQAEVEVLLHTLTVDVIRESGTSRLLGVIVENKSGRSAYLGRIIIDATGDGDVAFKTNVPFEFGDGEGRSQSMTTVFRMINVDPDQFRQLDRSLLRKNLEKVREEGSYLFQRVDPILAPAMPWGMVTANMTGIPDLSAVNAEHLTLAEIEGRRQVFEYLKFLRASVNGFEKAEVSSIATQIGIRETRRIQGEYVLDEREVLEGKKFDDAIALGAWPIELHDPATGRMIMRFLEREDDTYTIPLRCLIPRNMDNLLVAGRCISTTHVAQASTRVIGPAFAMGEAAGILAAESAGSNTPPKEVAPAVIQRTLKERGAILDV
jgi:hypothetical protein